MEEMNTFLNHITIPTPMYRLTGELFDFVGDYGIGHLGLVSPWGYVEGDSPYIIHFDQEHDDIVKDNDGVSRIVHHTPKISGYWLYKKDGWGEPEDINMIIDGRETILEGVLAALPSKDKLRDAVPVASLDKLFKLEPELKRYLNINLQIV